MSKTSSDSIKITTCKSVPIHGINREKLASTVFYMQSLVNGIGISVITTKEQFLPCTVSVTFPK